MYIDQFIETIGSTAVSKTICSIVKFDFFSNDLELRNNQNLSCTSQRVIQFIVDNFFLFQIIYPTKVIFKFLTFKIQSFQTI